MKVSASCLLAVASLFSYYGLLGVTASECNGGLRGPQYCASGDSAAHKVTKCPDICKESSCKKNDPAQPERNGAYTNNADTMNWEEITRTGLYEHVYIENDRVCLSSCWYWPWAAKCERWEEAEGKEYCGHLNCEHDDQDEDDKEDGGNRYSGCHAEKIDGEFELKQDWHKPTCNQCIRLFPQACYEDLKDYASKEDDKAAEYREEKLEKAVLQYCYDGLFSHLFDPDYESSSAGRRLLSDGDDDSSSPADDDDDSGEDDDDSTTGSSEEGTGLIGPSFKKQVRDWVEEEVLWMSAQGKIDCPAAQCLTEDAELLNLFAMFPEPISPAQVKATLSDPAQKWYHHVEGFCNWSECENGPEGAEWCNSGVDKCMGCNGAWCPVKASGVPLPPVTQEAYFPLLEPAPQDPWYLTTGEGYCSFQTCDGQADFGPWCSNHYENCHVCNGLWCPPEDKAGVWDPISKDGTSQELTIAGAPALPEGESFKKLSLETLDLQGRKLRQTTEEDLPEWMQRLPELADLSSCPVAVKGSSSEQVEAINGFLPTKGKLISVSPPY